MVFYPSSAVGLLSLLDEQNDDIRVHALSQLDQNVAIFWPEISHVLSKIEILYENPKFPQRKLAALLLAKVYYYLGEFKSSVNYALGAQELFDVEKSHGDQFVDVLIGKCIDSYIELRETGANVDSRLQGIVERMFKRCFDDAEFKQAIGIALECRRLDVVEEAIALVKNKNDLLKYTLDVSMTLVSNLEFRNMVLRALVKLLRSLPDPDFVAISQCLVWLNDVDTMVDILTTLSSGTDQRQLIALQIAFDIYEYGNQDFLGKVCQKLKAIAQNTCLTKILNIAAGNETIKLHLEFLFRNNQADPLILSTILVYYTISSYDFIPANCKNSVDSRNSSFHNALTFAHAFMNAGTTSDKFLRDNMEWLTRANDWAKFSATAQLGVIHKGNLANSKSLLSPYLPQEGTSVSSSVHVEGGALYAMGLIHANHGADVLPYLSEKLSNQNEVIQHGACLGVAAAGMATLDQGLYESLKTILFTDDAVAGEAAGLAMGLIMLGSGSSTAIEELLQYARETQHEKIIRGISIGIALVMYGKEELADSIIATLLADKDAILRYSGAYTIALAYVGTSSNKAIKDLLHIAVSDASDDVRRAAVTAIGFVLVKNPKQVPRIVQLLAESYNPHVRYGAAMALGISCAGTGLVDALHLLEPLIKDSIDYVRQGAYIAAAMILVQSNDSHVKANEYRKLFEKVITAKHEEPLSRFGAILSSGIIDAGGRNVTIALTNNGNVRMESVVGMAIFTQFWSWFPFAHFLSLSFTPTCLIGLNKDLKMPKFEFLSNAKPSLFAYPEKKKANTDEKIQKVATAILSTTAKTKARAKKAEKEKVDKDGADTTMMETDENPPISPETNTPEQPKEEKPKEEPLFEMVMNLSRVTPAQTKYIEFPKDGRYVPVKKTAGNGILLLHDLKADQPEELMEFSTPTIATESAEKEADPPQPFEYLE